MKRTSSVWPAASAFFLSLLPSVLLPFLIIYPVESPGLTLCVAFVLQSVGTRTVCGTWIKTAPGTTASTALSSHSAVGTATGATAAWTPSRWSQRGSRNAACSSSSGGKRQLQQQGFNLMTYLFICSTPRVSVCVHDSRLSQRDRMSFISCRQTEHFNILLKESLHKYPFPCKMCLQIPMKNGMRLAIHYWIQKLRLKWRNFVRWIWQIAALVAVVLCKLTGSCITEWYLD